MIDESGTICSTMLDKIYDMLTFAVPLRVIERPDGLVVRDYRPTWLMALGVGGFLFFFRSRSG